MTPEIFDIPNYRAGFRFSDESEDYYNGSDTFHDLAGYGPFAALEITAGTPAFVTDASGQRGMTLDNTCQGQFRQPIAWEGTIIAIMKASMGTNGFLYPLIFGGSGPIVNNGRLQVQRINSASYRYQFSSASASQFGGVNTADSNVIAVALGLSQETREGYGTEDGTTITTTTAIADDNFGNKVSPAFYTGPTFDGHFVRFGNLSGTLADTVATSNTMTIFEAHFFGGNPIIDSPTEVQAALAALRARYGVA
ncbi:hypothetical protein [Sagittula sp. S175]|uniref:hypothetical protein n=1 Tax=Sagittula sp. S175 TaxID=3415129 RepID=UPI003C7B0D66